MSLIIPYLQELLHFLTLNIFIKKLRPCKIKLSGSQILTLKKMMREGGYLIFAETRTSKFSFVNGFLFPGISGRPNMPSYSRDKTALHKSFTVVPSIFFTISHMKSRQKRLSKSTLVPFWLPFGITGSNDFVHSDENTRVFRIPST